MARRPILIGNWKMHKSVAEALDLARAVRNILGGVPDLDVGIAPPFTALGAVSRQVAGTKLLLCAQNCHFAASGAFTGEVSVPMLRDVGCSHVLVGHSERRQLFGEDDSLVNRKVHAVIEHGLLPVLCIGEQLGEREAGRTFEVVERQLAGGLEGVLAETARNLVVAYEPVWAIGTGKVATTAQAQEVHGFLRSKLTALYSGEVAAAIRIQYGGSVKPDNAAGLLAQPDIDGALIGGASLTAESYIEILKAVHAARS